MIVIKTIAFVVVFIVDIVCWIFGTSLTVNGETTQTAFIIKSILFWIAIILTFSVGLFMGWEKIE